MEFGSESTGFYKYGYWIQSLDDFSVTGGHLNGYIHSGVLLDKVAASKSIITGRFQGVYFDGNTSGTSTRAVTIQGTGGTGNFGGITFANGSFMGQATTENAFYINSANVKGVQIKNNDIWNYTQTGVDIAAGSGISVQGNSIAKNNTSAGAYDGISVADSLTDIDISGNTIGGEAVGSGTQTVGLHVGTGVTESSFAPNTYGAGNTTDYTVSATAQNMRLHGALEFSDGTSMSTAATGSGSGDVTSGSNITDHAIVRGDGGAKGVQQTGITVDDSNVVTASTVALTSSVADGASAIAFDLKVTNDLVTNGAYLLRLREATKPILDITRIGKFSMGYEFPSYTMEICPSSTSGVAYTTPTLFIGNGRANQTQGLFGIGGKHYLTAEEPAAVLYGITSGSGASALTNELNWGGGSSAMNAATHHKFWTAADAVTTTGTERMRIHPSGGVSIGNTTDPGAPALSVTGPITTSTTVNKVTITAPATASTLTIVDGSTLATSGANSITLTSTGTTNVTLPTSGTLATVAMTHTQGTSTTLDLNANDGFRITAASGTQTLTVNNLVDGKYFDIEIKSSSGALTLNQPLFTGAFFPNGNNSATVEAGKTSHYACKGYAANKAVCYIDSENTTWP